MAKKANGKQDSPGQVALERRLVAPDERLLAPVPVDYSVMNVTPDAVIHSLYQTRLPPAAEPPKRVDAALVGRFQYGPAHFKALVGLAIRQFLIMEVRHGRTREETVSFIEEQVTKTLANIHDPSSEKMRVS